MDELEVVQVSPSTALDRALRKESNKKRAKAKPDGDDEFVVNRSSSKELLESQGQELLWVEEQADSVPSPSKEKKKKGFRLLDKIRSSKRAFAAAVPPTKETKARVVLLPTPPASSNTATAAAYASTSSSPEKTRLQQAAAKAQQARALLDQALVLEQTPHERDEILRQAFCTAAEARRLVGSQDEHDLEQTLSSGEDEAREASRILSAASSGFVVPESQEEKKDGDNVLPPTGRSKENTGNEQMPTKGFSLSSSGMMKAANEHAEAVRRYLESMLPDFLDRDVSDDESQTQNDGNGTGAEETDTDRDSTLDDDDDDDDDDFDDNYDDDDDSTERKSPSPERRQRGVPRKRVVDEETKRRAAEKHAAIARVVQQNNSMSTLGFDNTFINEDTVTINSLNAFLDATMSGTAPTNSIEKTLDDSSQDNEDTPAPITITAAEEKRKEEKPKQKSKFGLFVRGKAKKATTRSAMVDESVQNVDKVDRFNPTIMPAFADEQELPDPEAFQHLVQIQDIERVTGDRLQAAMNKIHDAPEVTSWDGVPRHGIGIARTHEPFDNTVTPRDPARMKPAFVLAPKIGPGILSQKSWEDLADGASLQDVASLHSLEDVVSLPDERKIEPTIVSTRSASFHVKKRFSLFGFKKEGFKTEKSNNATNTYLKKIQRVKSDHKELAKRDPMSSTDVGIRQGPTASTSVEDPADEVPNNVSVMTDDSCMQVGVGEPDRYTALVDVEDQVHEAAQKRLTQTKPIVSDVDFMPDKPTPVELRGIRSVFSWGVGKHSEEPLVAKPSYVEVDGEDEAKVVLANKEEVLDAIQTSARAEPIDAVKLTRSETHDHGLTPSLSFVQEIAETKEKHAKERAEEIWKVQQLAKTKSRKKKGLYQRWKSRPAEV